jgi:hypothetical protein
MTLAVTVYVLKLGKLEPLDSIRQAVAETASSPLQINLLEVLNGGLPKL